MPKKFEKDGVEIQNATEFQTWTTKVRIYTYPHKSGATVQQTNLHVPKTIAEYLELQHQDFVQVAIRKLPPKENPK